MTEPTAAWAEANLLRLMPYGQPACGTTTPGCEDLTTEGNRGRTWRTSRHEASTGMTEQRTPVDRAGDR